MFNEIFFADKTAGVSRQKRAKKAQKILDADIMTVAKGIGGGFPMAAFLAKEDVAGGFVPGDHGTTFAGSPLAGAAANAVQIAQKLIEYMND